MSLTLLGLGTAVPATQVTQSDALRIAQTVCCRTEAQVALATHVHNHSGIATRHMAYSRAILDDVLQQTKKSRSEFLPTSASDNCGPTTGMRMKRYLEHAVPLAVSAARKALAESGTSAVDLTHLVTVSCTGFQAPGMELDLIHGLDLTATIERTHIGFMGCHGALNGLRVADAFAGADPAARILLCATELCSLHFHFGFDPQKMVANALFADGSAAVVGAALPMADAWRVAATGSCILPDSRADMGWVIGDHGFEMTLSRRIPELIAKNLRPWMQGWLGQSGLGFQDVRTWAVHPGGPMILNAVEEALVLPGSATAVSREVLSEFGNMSSATILFIIDRLRRRQAPRPCVALAFGPGMAAEAVLFQ
ncbi:MAG: type III polyketide synthase [Gemmataceae bacterium]|nr:type III polyketide synthase [Gemmataceae bacterium]